MLTAVRLSREFERGGLAEQTKPDDRLRIVRNGYQNGEDGWTDEDEEIEDERRSIERQHTKIEPP